MTDNSLLQDMFDRGCRGVIRQGQRSMLKGFCAYRSVLGLKCFVGQLIPDDRYDPEMDAWIMGVPQIIAMGAIPGVTPDDSDVVAFLYQMQAAHDGADSGDDGLDFVTLFKQKARDVADNFKLNPAVLYEE
jgi:hypothetical protein